MKHMITLRYLLGCIVLLYVPSKAFEGVKTVYLPRSQSVDAARELMGWQREINLYTCDNYWTFSLAPVYQHSFNPCALGNYILGGTSFNVTGSRVTRRSSNDILADYFGLPQDFQSVVNFCPVITSFIFDTNFYFGLNSIFEGFYIRIHAPIVHSKADLQLCEFVGAAGSDFYPAGYMGAAQVPTDELAHSVELAMQGSVLISGVKTPLTFGDMQSPLAFGKIFSRESRTGLSDVQLVAGWNFVQDDWYHLGLNIRAAIPSGSRPDPEFLLDAVVGNGKHWELGMGLTSHVDVWEHALWSCGLYLDANVTHLFSSEQVRSFQFKNNGPGSRYMLLELITPGSENLFLGVGGPAAPDQYDGHLFPAINVTTFCTKIAIPVQADIVAKCAFYRGDLEFDVGYNIWIRSAEKLQCRDSLAAGYAFKGDTQLYGFTTADAADPLNATQSRATIHGGQGVGNFVAGQEFTNANVDSPIVATSPGALAQLDIADSVTLGIPQLPINTSNPAVLLTDDDIDNNSALMPRSLTQKLFMHVGQRWQGCACTVPYIGCGFEVEFGGCTYNKSILSQWAVVFKGGLSY